MINPVEITNLFCKGQEEGLNELLLLLSCLYIYLFQCYFSEHTMSFVLNDSCDNESAQMYTKFKMRTYVCIFS